MRGIVLAFLLSGFGISHPAPAAGPPGDDPESLLPPEVPWAGASRALIAASGDVWITPAEASGFATTPSYDETISWLERLAAASPAIRLIAIGESWEHRTLWMAVVSSRGAATPEELRADDKPVLFAHGGIHAGEIDGKDAGLMLLRDLTKGSLSPLLDRVNLLFIPILNVDGHERISPLSRINQRGPNEMGWRTNARNLNLNRDYTKLDTPEVRAVVEVIERWQPDLYLDLHVTDGIDKQADITWGFNGRHAYSPAIAEWLEERLDPALIEELRAAGHIPGPHVFAMDPTDLGKGLLAWEGGPRYSDGYGGCRHLATVLVENHALKPYEQRVLGTRVLLQATLETLGSSGGELRQAARSDRGRRPLEIPVGFTYDLQPQPEPFEFLAIEPESVPSAISGTERILWTGKPVTIEVPFFHTSRPLDSVTVPTAYWVPAAWSNVIERLAAHGIEMDILEEPRQVEVEMYRLGEPVWATEPFEGRLRVTSDATPEPRSETFARGSARISTDQPLGVLTVLLLEPSAPDSFFQWGFFNSVFQRTEYAEAYILEPLAEQMLTLDPTLRQAFELRLAEDPEFAADPKQRLNWFYERSPFVDRRWRLYPVGRELY